MDLDLMHIDRPGGRIAAAVTGHGPLVVVAPGMGDLRSVFRDVVPPLVAAGHRVAALDLRGHGASDTTFTEHGVAAGGDDLIALVEHLGGPAVLVGHSVSAGSAAWAAGERPDLVAGLAMLSPHLTPATGSTWAARLQVSAMIRRPWGAAAWAWYYRSLHRGRHAPWFDEHVAAVRAALRDTARLRSLAALARVLVADHAPIALDRVVAPTLVVHGALDPEFKDPAAELSWATEHLTAAADVRGLLVPESGHYAHSQRPDAVVAALLELLDAVPHDEVRWARAGA